MHICAQSYKNLLWFTCSFRPKVRSSLHTSANGTVHLLVVELIDVELDAILGAACLNDAEVRAAFGVNYILPALFQCGQNFIALFGWGRHYLTTYIRVLIGCEEGKVVSILALNLCYFKCIFHLLTYDCMIS